uniref:Homeodomain interacting protein kinase 4 n=1 Tax=Myripristis murdjan TaxID=586833 RepID=A0A667Z8A7_9TELE
MRDLFSGTELYHGLDQVGQGTFGKVAKYWRSSDGELVAIKRMRLKLHRGVIHNELKLLGALRRLDSSSSHIVQFFEAFCDQTHHYLVFELLQKNIFQLQEEAHFRPMAMRHIRAIACQMLKALQKLEEISIIHGDLKPENIMLVDHIRRPFRVKLIDFGSASIFSEVCFIKEPYIQSRFYRSPEILLGLPFSGRMDMWSLGCVMSELYLGWPLYPGESEMEQVRFICETQGLPPCSLLDAASKAHLFFTVTKLVMDVWQEAAGKDRRKHILSSLDQLASLELTGHQRELRKEDRAAEETDRRSMVDLLKMILTLDAQERIAPFDALCHPFITTEHLSSSQELSQYHKACRLAMQQVSTQHPAGAPHPLGASGATRAVNSLSVFVQKRCCFTGMPSLRTLPHTQSTVQCKPCRFILSHLKLRQPPSDSIRSILCLLNVILLAS